MHRSVVRLAVEANAVQSGARLLILPLGEIKGRDGRYWDLTPGDAQALVNIVQAEGVDIVIDYDHSTCWSGGRAAGWLRNFQLEDAGITAEVEWTEAGSAAIASKEYRYLSPAFATDEGPRILRLHSVALVNNPNIAELPALNAAGVAPGSPPVSPVSPGPAASAAPASLEQLSVEQLSVQVQSLAGQVRLLTEQNASTMNALAAMTSAQQHSAVEALVANACADGRLTPAQRDAAIALGKVDKNALEALLNATPKGLATLAASQAGQGAGPTNGDPAMATLDGNDLAICKAMGLDPANYVKTKAQAGARTGRNGQTGKEG
ncbi:hypothetical protein DGI_2378 [Megalodesulfovibrio gigas DSM 1382 = ATCC 19364]|uniref:Mu-like prophage I protein n=2 Tax=Megalodesulfovibrio gigas TaxID=879 RepID=T2GC37_MEGG1|nr:hypothetical protein DGI_2378 [Megalodesulfovibrio gigas DSM 1382 = ATCC 19364]